MIWCENCKQTYDAPIRRDFDLGGGLYESRCVCPECGSDELSATEVCKVCKKRYPTEHWTNRIPICPECRRDIQRDLYEIISKRFEQPVERYFIEEMTGSPFLFEPDRWEVDVE
nr:MAG TPA: Protein involved in formate dehydrogenase formation [Bacteriophage sp.]